MSPVQSATPDERNRTRLLYTGSLGFLIAAEATHERSARTGEPEHWPAISVNVCFALELAQKALLTIHGASEQELRAIGHDLALGLTKAEALGYKVPDPAVSEVVATLSPLHRRSLLRYLEDRWVELPEPRQLITVAKAHIWALGAQIGVPEL